MATPQNNDKVTIACTGTLDNGEVFFVADAEKPFTVTIGESELPPTVENAVRNLEKGQTIKVRIPPEEGYGARQKDLLQTIENQELINRLNPKPGMIVSLRIDHEGEEKKVPATVMEVEGHRMVVDYNHPLAGHHLNYEITLLDIEKPSN